MAGEQQPGLGVAFLAYNEEELIAKTVEEAVSALSAIPGLTWRVLVVNDGSRDRTGEIAEELSVPVSRVTLVQCDTSLTPDQGTTSGSQSHPTNFNDGNLALAAATARETLLELASTRLSTPVSALTVNDGVVMVKSNADQSVSYAELIGGQ